MTDHGKNLGAISLKRGGGLLQGFGFSTRDDNVCPTTGKPFGDSQPDTPAGAGDQSTPAGQVEGIGHDAPGKTHITKKQNSPPLRGKKSDGVAGAQGLLAYFF